MMLVTGEVAQHCHGDPIDPTRPGAIDDAALRQAMALGHLDIEPFDHERSEAGTYEPGFTAHDPILDHHQRRWRRVLMDLLRYDGTAEI